MRTIDPKNMDIVYRGEDWLMDSDPTCKKMMKHLVRNEKIVTWLQPR